MTKVESIEISIYIFILRTYDYCHIMKYFLLVLPTVIVQSNEIETRETRYRRPVWKELLRIMKTADEEVEDGIGLRG